MNVYGLTGGIGSGKTTVSNRFKFLHVPVVDTDDISRQVVALNSPHLSKIASYFGSNVLLQDGTLNRPLLRKIIFENPEKKTWLENLLHPAIREETRKQINNINASYAILSSPLLIGSPDETLVDGIIVVDIPEEQQLQRVVERDSTDANLTKKIIRSQISREARLRKATHIIDNSGSLENTVQQVDQLHQRLLLISNKS